MHNQQNSPNKCPSQAIRFSKELLAYLKVIRTFLKSSFLFQNIKIVQTQISKEDKVRLYKGFTQSIQKMPINYKKVKRNPLNNHQRHYTRHSTYFTWNNKDQRSSRIQKNKAEQFLYKMQSQINLKKEYFILQNCQNVRMIKSNYSYLLILIAIISQIYLPMYLFLCLSNTFLFAVVVVVFLFLIK
ncbi:transmembrane protein, putative (macronuclear) [Tetrahymena thermophila SB210]|uniref:Transmembrane protein, putative n=1 Tax=Tetrahymena thermophila (strain SB210) TaxID=312017 RepID=W7XAB8_TETTS|nr:transmembrane protein, putative [Tetrahymena thermophila SB210]EWS73323.1 transmembrane protein, putative [Tetrahymena thermophila SB210]|eukprot:XP_012654142.1 transmembrane protein, putative [Tetrahymena thermophila SB210]